MFSSTMNPFYITQNSSSSNNSKISSSLSPRDTVQYGPISIRRCRKAVPTLKTGRRSKNLILVGEEAVKREKRREKNRRAARKLKEKRQLIEEKLHREIQDLKNQHLDLQIYLKKLKQRKENLQNELNHLHLDPIEELLSNNNHNMPLFFEQYSNDLDLFDESIEQMLNIDFNTNFDSVAHHESCFL